MDHPPSPSLPPRPVVVSYPYPQTTSLHPLGVPVPVMHKDVSYLWVFYGRRSFVRLYWYISNFSP